MNYFYNVIGIILVIFIIYYVYLYITRGSKIIILNRVEPILIITENRIKKPESILYTFSGWIYINSIKKNNTSIITYGANRLYIQNKIELWYDISGNSHIKKVNITNNFPLQQWVYFNISVNGRIYSFYLDGKLVKSIEAEFTTFPFIKEIVLGDNTRISNLNMRLANFSRKPKSLTHNVIALEYEKQKYIKDYYKFPKYNLEISLKNGNENKKSYSLFAKDKN